MYLPALALHSYTLQRSPPGFTMQAQLPSFPVQPTANPKKAIKCQSSDSCIGLDIILSIASECWSSDSCRSRHHNYCLYSVTKCMHACMVAIASRLYLFSCVSQPFNPSNQKGLPINSNLTTATYKTYKWSVKLYSLCICWYAVIAMLRLSYLL